MAVIVQHCWASDSVHSITSSSTVEYNVSLIITSSSAVEHCSTRCIAAHGKILKQSRHHNRTHYLDDMSSCC